MIILRGRYSDMSPIVLNNRTSKTMAKNLRKNHWEHRFDDLEDQDNKPYINFVEWLEAEERDDLEIIEKYNKDLRELSDRWAELTY